MGVPGKGHLSLLQFDEETTYGTPVTPTHKIEVINMNIDPIVGVIRDPSLYNAVARRGLFQGGTAFRGRFTTRCNYEGMGILLKGVLGAVITTGAGPFVHTFSEGSAPPSLTFQMVEGNIPAGNYQRVEGAYITALTIRGTAGQTEEAMVQCEFEVIAKNKVAVASAPTSITNFPALKPVLFHQATTVDIGTGDAGADIRLRQFEITFRNSYAEDRFYFGSTTIDQPIRNDFVSCQWRLTTEFQTMQQFQRAVSFTADDLELTFTSGADIMRFSSGSANMIEYGNPIESYGIILANALWEAWFDSSDGSSFRVINTNGKAAYDTAN